jgi:hypothetical protein
MAKKMYFCCRRINFESQKRGKMTIRTTEVKVEKDYRCPFCSDHEDCYYVIWEGLLDTPICNGCNYEIKISFVQMPEYHIWFYSSTLPHWERINILEELTGKSEIDLRLLFALDSLEYYNDFKNISEKIDSITDEMDDEVEKKSLIRQQQHYWIEGKRHAKKLIRKLLKLQEKIKEGNELGDIMNKWANASYVHEED